MLLPVRLLIASLPCVLAYATSRYRENASFITDTARDLQRARKSARRKYGGCARLRPVLRRVRARAYPLSVYLK